MDAPTAAPPKGARVTLPAQASGEVVVEEAHLSVRFALVGANDARRRDEATRSVYARGYRDADVIHRVKAEGVEDFVAFGARPEREELDYRVDVSRVAGLRLVSNTLELLDSSGVPRLRVNPPSVEDAKGNHVAAQLTVNDCAVDRSVAAPWGHAVTAAGANTCILHVSWSNVTYPAIVDPAWSTVTGMDLRMRHAAAGLLDGTVFVVGGDNNGMDRRIPPSMAIRTVTTYATTALLFNPTSEAYATGPTTPVLVDPSMTVLPSGVVLIAGGGTSASSVQTELPLSTPSTTAALLYDPKSGGAPTATGPMMTARQGHVATLLPSGKVLVTGGSTTGANDDSLDSPTNAAEVWDPTTGQFTATATAMSVARTNHFAAVLRDGTVLIAGGTSSLVAEIYDPATNSFTATTHALNAAHTSGRGGTLASGKVLVAGGDPTTAELYDPATQSFTPTVALSESRGRSPAVTGPNGDVVFVGIDSSETYDETSGAFQPPRPLIAGLNARGYAVAAFTAGSGGLYASGGGGPMGSEEGSSVTDVLLFATGGATCTDSGDCASGICIDGICCAGTCPTTPCHACAAPDGACVTTTNADDSVNGCSGTKTCDATGTCKSKNGQPCADTSTCASAFCADSVCCDTACSDGGCDRCNLVGTTGTCTIEPKGTVDAACVAPYICDGTRASCTSCVSDDGCDSSAFCGDNACVTKNTPGAACTQNDQCASGFCVDGVCCATACGDACMACAAALKQDGKDSGTCGPALDGSFPLRGTCATGATTCASDGKCDGGGGCRPFAPDTTSCGDTHCNGNVVVGELCNGSSTACDQSSVDCGTYLCVSTKCNSTCATTADCSATGYCLNTTCEPRRANGQACTAAEQCGTGICVDGVCCNSACTGQCEACDVTGAEGTCAPLTGTPHGSRPACPTADAANPCAAAQCDGNERLSCAGFAGAQVTCGQPSCTNAREQRASICDGAGACKVAAPVACGAFACGPTACKTACANDADCADGNICDTTTSKCVSGATCDGDHTSTSANGQKIDCAPYKCDATGACRTGCKSVDDCVAPELCDVTGTCVAPTAADNNDASGCALAPRGNPKGSPFAVAALLVVGWSLRRRRSTQSTALF